MKCSLFPLSMLGGPLMGCASIPTGWRDDVSSTVLLIGLWLGLGLSTDRLLILPTFVVYMAVYGRWASCLNSMADTLTLRTLFDSKKTELEQKLDGYYLPKDNKKIQQTISDYLSALFDSDGEYRQNLTQTEDYLLQASLSLLTAQQEICSVLISQNLQTHNHQIRTDATTTSFDEGAKELKTQDKEQNGTFFQELFKVKISAPNAAVGSAAGALTGKLVFGGWGAVFGAIAGTAVMVYIAGRNKKNVRQSALSPIPFQSESKAEIINEPINVQQFTKIVGSICDSVDNLISTFRAQVNKVIDKYESMDKPTIEKQYSFLLESIQTLIGYKRTHTIEDDRYIKKIQGRIEDLAECLENYNLTTEDYNGENDHLFELISSPESTEVKMAYPAIVKDGVAVLKGKVFIPTK